MEKITDKIAALPKDANYCSLEFFPPKTRLVSDPTSALRTYSDFLFQGFTNLQTRLERMSSSLRPLFIAVTWGAGGSTAAGSLELADICQRQLGLTTCLHLTCTNMKRRMIDDALNEAKKIGVRNILALRGDPPRSEEYRLDSEAIDGEDPDDSNEDFTWAIDLVRYIRKEHGDYFCIGVAGYPEGHADQSHPTDQDPLHDLPYLIDKTSAGADFIMTQLFYDLDAYFKYEKLLREHESGVFATIPIIPGLMPIQSFEILKRTTKLAHVTVPRPILEAVERVRGDDEAVKRVGVKVISEIVEAMKIRKPRNGPQAFHFYTLNLEKAVAEIVDQCGLILPESEDTSAIDDSTHHTNGMNGSNGVNGANGHVETHNRTFSSSSAAAQLTSNDHHPSTASDRTSFSRATLKEPKIPRTVSREAIWDDYPNGRFSDARSPAFNPPLTYSPTSLNVTPAEALSLWGTPISHDDLTSLFLSHIAGSDPTQLPWSESNTLNPETALIRPELSTLTNEKGYWTICSQPSVDGLASTHPIHGWGPTGGFVFQKSFVEFFMPSSQFLSTLHPRLEELKAQGEVSYYAVNAEGQYLSSEPKTAVHAVTWGAFKGREIATATMVEEVSFRAWGEDAFAIWAEWARCVGEMAGHGHSHSGGGSSSSKGLDRELGRKCREFLTNLRRELWLINIIGHEYQDRGKLWRLLSEA